MVYAHTYHVIYNAPLEGSPYKSTVCRLWSDPFEGPNFGVIIGLDVNENM